VFRRPLRFFAGCDCDEGFKPARAGGYCVTGIENQPAPTISIPYGVKRRSGCAGRKQGPVRLRGDVMVLWQLSAEVVVQPPKPWILMSDFERMCTCGRGCRQSSG
jgi:hypothetical protein